MSEQTRTYPALGPGIWWVLLRNEWFKTRHRLAFVVSWALFTLINVLGHGGEAYRAMDDPSRSYALPEVWSEIFSGNSTVALIFGSIAVVMLVASEFSWRTSRQNVIDGIDKMQWYWGKVMLLVLVGVVFIATQIGIGTTAAALGTNASDATSPLVPLGSVLAAVALGLAFLNVGGLALLCATTIRSSGPAMAVWFAWVSLGEQLIPQLVTRIIPSARPVLEMLPFAAAQQVLPFWRFDATTYEAMTQRALEAGEAVPELPNMLLWVGTNAAWAALFVGVGYLAFRRRDL